MTSRTPAGLVLPTSRRESTVEASPELLEVALVRYLEAPNEREAIAAATAILEAPPVQGVIVRSFVSLDRAEMDPDVTAWRLVYTEHRLYLLPVAG